MNVSMPAEIRHLVKQGAISTAALERETLDDSAWIVRAVCEKLAREWDVLEFRAPVPDLVLALAANSLAVEAGICEGAAAFPQPGALPAVAA
jgi:hypothetical protein